MEKKNHRKQNGESHKNESKSLRMSMACPYLLGVTAVLEGSFPNLNLIGKENSIHYSLLIDMFGKAEMQVK